VLCDDRLCRDQDEQVLDKPSVVIAGLLFRTLERVGRQVELLRRAQPMRRRARITIRRLSPAICVVAGLALSFPAYDPGNGIKSLQLLRARVSVERFPSHGARAALACPATPVAHPRSTAKAVPDDVHV
jgi:uncharacterized protein (DUF934 family)